MKYLLVIMALFLFAPPSAHALWLDSNWDYRVPINVVPSKVGTTSAVTNFPVYVDLTGFPNNFWSSVQNDGDDIRVVESDEITETPFELVSISTASSTGELHFLADSLSTTSTSTFYVYYGNPGASGYASSATYGRNNVWSQYLLVAHMQNTSTSSSGSYDLTNNNVTYQDGQIYRAGLWNSTSDNMTNSSTIFDFGRLDDFTISLWVDSVSTSSNQFMVSNQQNTGDFLGWGLYHGSNGTINFDMYQDLSPVVGYAVRSTSNYLYDTNDRHIVFSKSTSADVSGARMYRDGSSVALTTVFNSLSASPTYTTDLQIGNRQNAFNLNADISEFRISTNELSLSWVVTEYNNQSSTSTFLFIGAQESETAPEATSTPSSGFGSGMFSNGIFR
jgi:hypothetical protein